MWLTKRNRRREADTPPSLEQLRAEIAALRACGGAEGDVEVQRRLLQLRHLAGIGIVAEAPANPSCVSPDGIPPPAGDPLPELRPPELTAPLVRAAILRDGCALIRGLLTRADAVALADDIDRAYTERSRIERGEQPDPSFYTEFHARGPFTNDPGRLWVQAGGGLLAADAPGPCARMMERFLDAEIPALVDEYLGEPAVISLHKTTLRKAAPEVGGGWHQDGIFMGPVRALNLWLALSDCGEDAPGLDLVPRRLDDYLATGTGDAKLSWTISEDVAADAAGALGVIRPVFAPGDALLFDERFLHKTGSDPAMPNPRFAIESWFFGGSAFPADYAPLAV